MELFAHATRLINGLPRRATDARENGIVITTTVRNSSRVPHRIQTISIVIKLFPSDCSSSLLQAHCSAFNISRISRTGSKSTQVYYALLVPGFLRLLILRATFTNFFSRVDTFLKREICSRSWTTEQSFHSVYGILSILWVLLIEV
jgi:hypothetical protein